MKSKVLLGLMAGVIMSLSALKAQTPADMPQVQAASAVPMVSPGAAEVVKMAEAGTSDEVLLAYVENSTVPFELSADQVLYLRDLGLSSPVIAAMLNRDAALRVQPAAYDQNRYQPAEPAAAPVQSPVFEPAPVPAPAVVEAPAPVYVTAPPAEVSYFYDDLAPYGTWAQLDGVGWCWQPRVVAINHAWRPYCDSGQWAYTDAGWCWQSDYSWGWAPFHYGRWFLHERCGWVWTPDRVWGPAWVTWRSEGDYCGWAPLPPHADFDFQLGYRFRGLHVGLDFDFGLRPEHFAFIALRDFHEHDFAHHRLPSTQVNQIYNHTTVINNYAVHNNTIVNQGIRADRVAAATHTEVRPLAIRDVPAPRAAGARLMGRNELAVYRPQLRAPASSANLVAQKIDARHPVIEHGPLARPYSTPTPKVGLASLPLRDHAYPNAGSQNRKSDRPGHALDSSPAMAPATSMRPSVSGDPREGHLPPMASGASGRRTPSETVDYSQSGSRRSSMALPPTINAPGVSRTSASARTTVREVPQSLRPSTIAGQAPLRAQPYRNATDLYRPLSSDGQNSAAHSPGISHPSAESHLAQQAGQPFSRVASAPAAPNRVTQFQAPTASPNAAVSRTPAYVQPQPYQPQRPGRATTPSATFVTSSARTANQFKPATPVIRPAPQVAWQIPRPATPPSFVNPAPSPAHSALHPTSPTYSAGFGSSAHRQDFTQSFSRGYSQSPVTQAAPAGPSPQPRLSPESSNPSGRDGRAGAARKG